MSELFRIHQKPFIQSLNFDNSNGNRVDMLRLDVVHPEISGNKWWKLKYNLIEAKEKGFNTLLTFGGAYSNHIAATAAAGKEFDFKTIGIIRGEELNENSNETLKRAKANGMDLHFVSRNKYREKEKPEFFEWVKEKFGNVYIIPEGGSNELALKGVKEIWDFIPEKKYDIVCCAVGTGGMYSGLFLSQPKAVSVMGFLVLKIQNPINLVREFIPEKQFPEVEINGDYHFGGYGKTNAALKQFVADFQSKNNIPIDFVYNAKMLYGVFDLAETGKWKNKNMLVLNSGGLQVISR